MIGNVDLTEQVLIKSATPVLDNQCLPGPTPVSPNPAYGYGLLDIYAAVQMALTPRQAAVKVTNTADEPQDQLNVVLVDKLTGYAYRAETGFDGVARIPLLYHGTYSLRISEGGTCWSSTISASRPAQSRCGKRPTASSGTSSPSSCSCPR